MIPSEFQSIANHLWQSTLFAGAAALLALALRKNRAHVRYWIWLAASAKFLIPFSLLVSIGGLFERPAEAPMMQPVTLVIEQVSQPFTPALSRDVPATPTPAVNWTGPAAWSVWAAGYLFVMWSWWRRSRRIRVALRTGSPVDLGLDIQAIASPEILEPGVIGVLRPLLMLPAGITGRLTPEQLKAILAHEVCHMRRRDNLTSLIHLAVEAVFWFHPLVWWLGARLIEERERACDEEVLRSGAEPHDYAEGILRICEMHLEPPVLFVAGVAGSNLKNRIEAIMTNRISLRLDFARRAALAAAAMLAIAVPIAVGILRAAPQSTDWEAAAGGRMAFEVASVKPGEFMPPSFPLDTGDSFRKTGGRFIANFPLFQFIMFAYKINPAPEQREAMLAGLPDWVTTDRYTIEGKAEGDPVKDQYRLMVRSLLAERFKLAVHYETKEASMYALVLAAPGKLGPRLKPHADNPRCDPKSPVVSNDGFPCGNLGLRRDAQSGGIRAGARNLPMSLLASLVPNMSRNEVDRPVVDRTGLTGGFDFTMASALPPVPGIPPDPDAPVFRDTLRDELGLKLEPIRGTVQVLMIDHVERPAAN